MDRARINEVGSSSWTAFRVLGPVEAEFAGQVARLSRRHERGLLAVLLLEAGRVVPVPRLAGLLWGDRPPAEARAVIHTYISRVRSALAGVGADAAGIEVVRHGGGYLIDVERDSVDVHRFADITISARSLQDAGDRAARLREALELWRGPALANVGDPLRTALGERLELSRQSALAARIEADLEVGATDDLVGELIELTAVDPLSERFTGLLMHALSQTGRRADALAAYRRFRDRTVEELGIEPGQDLQQLHRRVLDARDESILVPEAPQRADVVVEPAVDLDGLPLPVLDRDLGLAAPSGSASPVPRELPAVASCFVGRDANLPRIRGVLAASGQEHRPAVVVLYGPGGVGKSALAVRAGQLLAAEFPDGQLYVDLFGSTPGMRPLPVAETLGRCLRSLGVHPREVPADEIEASALLRTVTADRRVLLVLDNAADRGQVVPLLPSGPSCSVLITSRQPLGALDADDRLRVDPLPDESALELIVGLTPERVISTDVGRELVSYTGGLPLAVRIAAGRLASRPDLSADEYATRLADRSRRLDELQLEDLAVRASIRSGYEALTASDDQTGLLAARAFRVLGLLHVPDVAPWVVASMLAEPDVETVRAALDRLVYVQLAEPMPDCRYRLHDLVHLVATEYALTEDTPDKSQQALHRAIAYYNEAMWQAEWINRPKRLPPFTRPTIPDGVLVPDITTPARALAVVDRELRNAVAVLEQTAHRAGSGTRMSLWLSDVVWDYLDRLCDWSTAYRVGQLVHDVGIHRDDRESVAWGLVLLGRSKACLGRADDAIADFERALPHLRELQNDVGVALALNGIGVVRKRCGQPVEALRSFIEATEHTGQKDPSLTGAIYGNICGCYAMLGRLDEAMDAARKSERLGGRSDLSAAINVATVCCLAKDYARAIEGLDTAVAMAPNVGDRRRLCEALITRSEVRRRLGNLRGAAADAERALERAREGGYRHMTAAAHVQLAKVLVATGETERALQERRMADAAQGKVAAADRDSMVELVLAQGDLLDETGHMTVSATG